MSSLHDTLATGESVGGNYEVLGKAGSGGMGVVYRALDRRLKRTVALKFLPAHLSDSPRDRARFLNEARTASSLDHPNIGVIYAIEETEDGRGFIVMAYYDGQPLDQRIGGQPLPQLEAVDIAIQMASGLAAAHAHHIVHRDVKPSNVMLTCGSGNGAPSSVLGCVRIVDFGIARIMTQETDTQSRAGGTPNYMSPEQALERGTDARTDIWSLGVTLAEMLTGRCPFSRESFSETILAILKDPPQPMPGVHPVLQGIVYRALAKDVATRYQSMSEMLADLEQLRPELAANAPAGRASGQLQFRKAVQNASDPAIPELRSARPFRLALYGLMLLLMIGGALLLVTPVRERLAGVLLSSSQKHIAVLPFDNVSGDPGDSVLVAGLVGSLSNQLSALDAGGRSLWVVPGSEVRRLKIDDPAEALDKLGATLVVSGSVNKHGRYLQMTVNLIDSRRLRQIGSFDLEDANGDIAGLETQAVSRLARLMNLKVRDSETQPATSSSAPAAYENYLKALGYMERYDKAGNVDLAIAALQQSIAIDPKFAVSYAQLGEAYRTKYELSKDPQWLEQAEANCKKALELNPELASAYVTLGQLHGRQQPELALQEFQHALALDTHSAAAESGLAALYQRMGRMPEAEAAYQKAIALQPDDWNGYDVLGNFYAANHRYAEAFPAYERAQELTPDNSQVMNNLASAEMDAGDPKLLPDAERLFKSSISINPTYQAYANLAVIYAQTGRYAEAAEATEHALAIDQYQYVIWSNLIGYYEWLGREDKAEETRKKAIGATERAVKLDPRDANAEAVLADEYARSGNREEALNHIRTAMVLAPDDPDVLSVIADAYEGLGGRAQALAVLNKALQKGLTLEQMRADPEARGLVASLTRKH